MVEGYAAWIVKLDDVRLIHSATVIPGYYFGTTQNTNWFATVNNSIFDQTACVTGNYFAKFVPLLQGTDPTGWTVPDKVGKEIQINYKAQYIAICTPN